jgi:hypothetical protein
LGTGLAGREQDFRTADHKDESAGALHEGAPFDAVHDFPPVAAAAAAATVVITDYGK